jgi:gamma-carbonic anhydrase
VGPQCAQREQRHEAAAVRRLPRRPGEPIELPAAVLLLAARHALEVGLDLLVGEERPSAKVRNEPPGDGVRKGAWGWAAEDGRIEVGTRCVVMENAVVRGRAAHPVELGEDVLVGPHAHLNGAVVGDGCFLATGCSLFPGSRLGRSVEVRINGVVHVNTTLEDGGLVPIGWVAVGDPAQILPPGEHEAIWEIQQRLDFPGTVYGVARDTPARERMQRQAAWFAAHGDDRVVEP